MALVFIHGVAQDADPAHQGAITKLWLSALLKHDINDKIAGQRVTLAYYADILHQHSNLATVPDWAELLGELSLGQIGFKAEVARDVALAMRPRVPDKAPLPAPPRFLDLYPRLALHWTPVRTNPSLSPDELIRSFKRFLMEADTYFTEPAAAAAIDARVQGVLETALAAGARPIIIAHSLGSVIAYKLLSKMSANFAPGQIPLLITMGSPLAIKAIRRQLPVPFKRPAIISQWRNHYHRRDLIAAGSPIPVSGDASISNHWRHEMDFPYHAAEAYLHDHVLAGHVLASL